MVTSSANASLAAVTRPPNTGRRARRSAVERVRRLERCAPHADDDQLALWARCAAGTADRARGSRRGGVHKHERRHAANRSRDPDRLRQLSRDPEPGIRKEVAYNPNCPAGVLALFARSRDLAIRAAAAGNPNCPPRLLVRLAADPDSRVRSLAVRHRACPPEAARRVAADRSPTVCLAVWKHPGCGRSSLGRGLDSTLRRVADTDHARLTHNSLPEKAFAVVASNPNCPAGWLAKASREDSVPIRAAVARNPTANPDDLRRLSRSAIEDIRAAVARNPNCPSGVLPRLVGDNYFPVACAAARHPRLPPRGFKTAATEPYPRVRVAVASNPNCPRPLLVQLAADNDDSVRSTALKHPDCPPRARRAAEDTERHIREAEEAEYEASLAEMATELREAKPGSG